MARIPYRDPTTLPPEDREFLANLPPLNAFRLLSGCPSLFRPLIRFFSTYLNDGLLDEEIREIVILRVGYLCKSEYEVTQHIRAARSIGMSEERIDATLIDGNKDAFSEQEIAVLDYVDDVVTNAGASQITFDALAQHFSPAEMIELTVIAGTYVMWCQLFNSFDIDNDDKPIPATSIQDIQQAINKMS
jgi:alkylhydroperoxidase family enzyme